MKTNLPTFVNALATLLLCGAFSSVLESSAYAFQGASPVPPHPSNHSSEFQKTNRLIRSGKFSEAYKRIQELEALEGFSDQSIRSLKLQFLGLLSKATSVDGLDPVAVAKEYFRQALEESQEKAAVGRLQTFAFFSTSVIEKKGSLDEAVQFLEEQLQTIEEKLTKETSPLLLQAAAELSQGMSLFYLRLNKQEELQKLLDTQYSRMVLLSKQIPDDVEYHRSLVSLTKRRFNAADWGKKEEILNELTSLVESNLQRHPSLETASDLWTSYSTAITMLADQSPEKARKRFERAKLLLAESAKTSAVVDNYVKNTEKYNSFTRVEQRIESATKARLELIDQPAPK